VLASSLFGLVIGMTLGLLGGGGSILAVPALVYGLGQPVAQAVSTSLLVVGISAVAGSSPSYAPGRCAGGWPWDSRSLALLRRSAARPSIAGYPSR
jgi:uncharacterized membrane protein YfcA